MVLRPAIVIASVLLLAVPALAAEGTFQGSVALPIEAPQGQEAQAHDARALLTGDAGSVAMVLEGEATLTRVVHRSWGHVQPDDPELKVLWEERVDRDEIALRDATLVLEDRLDTFQLLVQEAQVSTTASASAATWVGMLGEDHLVEAAPSGGTVAFKVQRQAPFHDNIPRGMLQTRSDAGTLEATGTFQAYIGGAILHLHGDDGREIRANQRIEERPGTVYNPVNGQWLGSGSHDEFVLEYLLIEATDARLVVEHARTPATIYAMATHLAIDGSLRLAELTGTVAIEADEAQAHHIAGQDTVISGIFEIEARDASLEEGRAQVHGSGDITGVSYGAHVHTYDWAKAVATVTLGTLLLGALAWTAKALGGGAVAGYARVQGPKVLEHPGRSEVYERIKQNPGIGFSDLVKTLDFGESTLQYHLRVLERNEFVTQVKDGRYLRFFDRQSGLYSSGRKVAVSALRNDTTAKIASVILQQPGIAQRDLATRFGIAASTVNWHIQRLHKAGLVDRRRDHPHTRYYAGDAWSSIPHDEHARLIAA